MSPTLQPLRPAPRTLGIDESVQAFFWLNRFDQRRVTYQGKSMKSIAMGFSFFVAITGMLLVVSGCGQPDQRYQILGSAGDVVLDTVTLLEWQRCSLGQSWDGQTCTGAAERYRWPEELKAARDVADWRLPTIEELQTLVYCSSGEPARFPDAAGRCRGEFQHPTIVSEVFPNTPIWHFWSGSHWDDHADSASVVNFGDGSTGVSNRGVSHRVRLVRGAQ